MSKYTTEVRYICEQASGFGESRGYADVETIIGESRSKIFDFAYPIFDEAYREPLERKILRHYYTREIGFETVGLWKFKLATKMAEIMPYYNQLYQSQLLKFNPLQDTDINTTNKGTRNSDMTNNLTETNSGTSSNQRTGSDTESTTTSNKAKLDTVTDVETGSKNRFSDTPQGGLDGIENDTYLTNVTLNDGTSKTTVSGKPENEGKSDTVNIHNSANSIIDDRKRTNTGTQNNRTTDDYIVHVIGKSAGTSYSKMLQEFRKTFLNIDIQIINDLSSLFLLLW